MKNDNLEDRLAAIERAISFISVALLENTPADVYQEDIDNIKNKLKGSSIDAQVVKLLDPFTTDPQEPF
ncbi:hypothetical protein FE392_10895 [Xenorhabdus sp. 12]|uniref:Uncharacterized protein n=1 Tax=Xenorhabdus santafensis TaxID=2582833 RepID=A0ABU4SAK1_9GAMM|nr:hypothetical protein [Xenorhabdus sp. 12]MDX7987833.1 hypothetical protein [Xenorhabdus sp. 12]